MQEERLVRYVIKCSDGTYFNPHNFPEERRKIITLQEAPKFYTAEFAQMYLDSAPKGSKVVSVEITYKEC